MMKKTVLFAMGLVAVATTHAQNTIESTVSADVVSKYVWRGLELRAGAAWASPMPATPRNWISRPPTPSAA